MSTLDVGNPGFCAGCGLHYSHAHSPRCPLDAILRHAVENPPEEGPSLPCERCGVHLDDCACWFEFAPSAEDYENEEYAGGEQ